MRRRATLMLLAVTLIWGATFVWMRSIMLKLDADLDALGWTSVVAFLVGMRFAMAAVLLPLFPQVRATMGSKEVWSAGAVLGLVLLFGFVAQMVALGEIDPSTSAFLTSLYVVSTALLAGLFGERRPGRTLWFGVVVATLGAAFIEGPPHLTWGWAEAITVFCALCFAFHILLTQRYTRRYDPLGLSFTSFLTLALASFGVALLTLRGDATPGDLIGLLSRPGVMPPLLALSLLGSLTALVLLNVYQRHLEPVRAVIIYTLEPVWATVYGLLLGMVPWTWWILVGGGLLLTGNVSIEVRAAMTAKGERQSVEGLPSGLPSHER